MTGTQRPQSLGGPGHSYASGQDRAFGLCALHGATRRDPCLPHRPLRRTETPAAGLAHSEVQGAAYWSMRNGWGQTGRTPRPAAGHSGLGAGKAQPGGGGTVQGGQWGRGVRAGQSGDCPRVPPTLPCPRPPEARVSVTNRESEAVAPPHAPRSTINRGWSRYDVCLVRAGLM